MIGITVNLMFHNFVYLSNKVTFFDRQERQSIQTDMFVSSYSLVFKPRLNDPFGSKNPKKFWHFYFQKQILVCGICHFYQWLNSSHLHISQLIIIIIIYS